MHLKILLTAENSKVLAYKNVMKRFKFHEGLTISNFLTTNSSFHIFWLIGRMSFLAMCLTVDSNGLEEECSEEQATDFKTDDKSNKKQTKQAEVPSEETPLKKKKKKRKLAGTAESPGDN